MSSPDGITLREFIDREFSHQTTLLNERARHHEAEHDIHLTAHTSEHDATQLAIKVATDALDKRLETMELEVSTKLDTLTKAVKAINLERANARGYVVGVGVVLGIVVTIMGTLTNFLLGLFGVT